MGFLESLSSIGDWFQQRWNNDWEEFRNTYKSAWTEQMPKAWHDFWSGSTSIASIFTGHPGDGLRAARLLMDGTVGMGGALLSGTIGGLFQAPVANELTFALDKAYRYSIARPFATAYLQIGGAARTALESGDDYLNTYFRELFDGSNVRENWNATEQVTPGQAMTWMALGSIGAVRPGNPEDPGNWLRAHDPRSVTGNQTFNSENSEFLLKYASGGIDFMATVVGDPAVATASLIKFAKNTKYDRIASADYVQRRQHEAEINTKAYQKFSKAVANASDPMALWRRSSLFHTRFGPTIATVLWRTKKEFGDDAFRDAYIVARGQDGLFGDEFQTGVGNGGMGAWDRLTQIDPSASSDFARIFANFNIGDDAIGALKGQTNDNAVQSLVANDADAWTAAILRREGVWGKLPGLLQDEAQPRAHWGHVLRDGIHTWLMDVAPVHIGRPLARVGQAFLPTTGYTPLLDAEDSTQIGAKQFRALVERYGMSTERVDHWTAQWGAKGSREGRNEVYFRMEDEGIRTIAGRLGIDQRTIDEAMPAINKYRDAARRLARANRIYFPDAVALAASKHVAESRKFGPASLRDMNRDLSRLEREGKYGMTYVAMPNVDGHANFLEVPDQGQLPGQAPDQKQPLLLSQTERMIPTVDGRALESQLKWWMRAHPTELVRMLDTGAIVPRRQAGPQYKEEAPLQARGPRWPSDRRWEELPQTVGSWTLSKVAKLHDVWDMTITAGDFFNMVWKSSALLRPAQTPRNLADDVFRRSLIFGRAPIIAGAMRVPRRTYQNVKLKRQLKHEAAAEVKAERRSSGTSQAVFESDRDGRVRQLVPMVRAGMERYGEHIRAMNDKLTRQAEGKRYKPRLSPEAVYIDDIGEAWKQGLIPIDELIEAYEWLLGTDTMHSRVPQPIRLAFTARDQGVYHVEMGQSNRSMAERAPTLRAYADRQLKRRIVEYYYQRDLTEFLDDLRLDALDLDGMPLDPKRRDQKQGEIEAGDTTKARLIDQRIVWLRRVMRAHLQRRFGQNAAVDPYTPGQIVVDPFTGDMPASFDMTTDFTLGSYTTLDFRAKPGVDQAGTVDYLDVPEYKGPSRQLGEFIIDHIDEILKPDAMLALTVMPDGNIRASVAYARPEAKAKGPVKRSAAYRLRNFKFKEILDAGHESVRIRLNSGGVDDPNIVPGSAEANAQDVVINLPGPFEGESGQAAQFRVSASEGQGTAYYLTGEMGLGRMLQERSAGFKGVRPEEKSYATDYERAVNSQLAGDDVARLFLEGRSQADVATWIEGTAQGTKYLHRMHYRGVHYLDHIAQIEAMVNLLAPDGHTKMGRALREKILDRSASRFDLDRVRPRPEQPEVHGASVDHVLGKGAVFNAVARGIDQLQRWLADIPTDKASRYPFFAESYKRHLTSLVRAADVHAFRADDVIPVKLMKNLEQQARDKALHDTKYYLYDVAQINDVAKFFRFIVPFSTAIMDAYIKYGRIIKNNPGVILQGLYYWELFERNGAVQDENGYVLAKNEGGIEDGPSEKWYAVDPDTGEKTEVPKELVGQHRYIQFRFPSDFLPTEKLFGTKVKPAFAMNKQTLQVFLGLPSTGPVVAVPANEFALSNPEFAENKWIQRFVLPFGPSVDRGRNVLPSNVRSAIDTFINEDGNTAEGHAKAIYQAELIAYGRGERDHPPTFGEVREKAAALRAVRLMATWASPVSFNVQSPYQPYVDAMRQLMAENPTQANEQFMARHGEEFYALAMSVTRNNAGIRATVEDHKAYLKHKELITAYPELAGLIVGSNGGSFSKAVYEAQKELPLRAGQQKRLREIMSLQDSAEAVERQRVWDAYSKMQDLIVSELAERGLTTTRGKQAQDLARVRDQFVEANKMWRDPETGRMVESPWYKDFKVVDHEAMESRIGAMWEIVQDPNLRKRDDIRALVDYLHIREQMQVRMAEMGLRTLNSVKARQLSSQWESQVLTLLERNPAFGPIWSRWLERDTELTIPKVVSNG